uniref:Tyrosine-protein kinase n=1 Tax=Sphenodon punctatus TaxID=8508 RepID=A0A8D0L9S7_SPHPU
RPTIKRWPPGTQCIAKHDHTKPKACELAFRKGDIITILEACENKGWYKAKHNENGAEGLLGTSSVREREAIRSNPKLSLMPWFHGKISGIEAVQALQPPEDGLFLVRESIRHPGDYVLCVSFGKEVIHYHVIYQESQLSIETSTTFYNLIDMIEYYTKEKGALCSKLVKPKAKPGTKSAEAELAKGRWRQGFGGQGQDEGEGVRAAAPLDRSTLRPSDVLAPSHRTLRHRNLVRLLGVILHNGLYLVMEFMRKGNLVNFLRTRGRAVLLTKQLLQFALDVSQGMEYLESKKLVHRDLAARNILISEENVAKVSDFGLAKMDTKGTDATKLPVKWTAPEALKHNVSDSSFSCSPQKQSSSSLLLPQTLNEVVEQVEKGYRMEEPEECPPSLYTLMKSCWEQEPAKRPSFKKLSEKLQKELKRLGDS